MAGARAKQRKRTQKYTEEDLRAEIRRSAFLLVISMAGTILNSAVKWGCILGCVWIGAQAFVQASPDLAGKDANLGIVVRLFADVASKGPWASIVLVLVIASPWLLYFYERQTRKRTTARMSDEQRETQLIIDKDRSSSGMYRDGSSPEGD